MSDNLRMCRFLRNGEPDMGEYLQLDDGTGLCHLSDLNGKDETIIVSYPDGTMPDGISDLELINVPFPLSMIRTLRLRTFYLQRFVNECLRLT